MPRQVRIQYENAVYHVMARGNRRERIYVDDEDREIFLRTLAETCDRTGFEVFAWVLMDNHYHLVLRTPEANLVAGMSWLQNTVTRRFNARHKLWGRLFGDRYRAILVEDDPRVGSSRVSGPGYLPALIDYVHLNPARARIIRTHREDSISDYPWSSLAAGYLLTPRKRPGWLLVNEALGLFDLDDTACGRRRYVKALNSQVASEQTAVCGLVEIQGQSLHSTLRRGWYWGSEAFRDKLLRNLNMSRKKPKSRNYQSSTQGSDRSRDHATEIIASGARHFGLSSPDTLRTLGRTDRRRVAIAWALCKLTSMPQQWIAERTNLRSAANVSQQVRRFDQLDPRSLSPKERDWKNRMLGSA